MRYLSLLALLLVSVCAGAADDWPAFRGGARNGTADSSTALYHAVFFRDLSEGNMLGIVFDAAGHVAILHLDRLGFNPIGNGPNAWQSNKNEAALRRAIRKHQKSQENQT